MSGENQPVTPKTKNTGGRAGSAKSNAAKRLSFYHRLLKNGEIRDLESLRGPGLEDEIGMLRVIIRRVVELAEGLESLEEATGTLNCVGSALTRLARLLEIQKRMTGANSEVEAAFLQALAEVQEELGLVEGFWQPGRGKEGQYDE